MVFTSLVFILFAICFFFLYAFCKKREILRYLLIVAASFIFYGWWDWRYIFLIVFTGCIDFFFSLLIDKYRSRRKLFLSVSIFCNLAVLFSFKYLIWALDSLSLILRQFDVVMPAGQLSLLPDFLLVLPVGISFYTFQSMSYTIDVYRGELRPTRNILHYFSYLSMFPQLVAGPIVRARDVLAQLERPAVLTGERLYGGLERVATGFFKKTVIADTLAPFVNAAFAGDAGELGATQWWIVLIAFAIQIYFDFSGYSDIAIGLARWMGIDFKDNFHFPYLASSPSDFWRRWHISLSSWFRDYVYIPLGGSRVASATVHRNIWITMLLSGVWHGAAWHYVVWGGFHALLLSGQRLLHRWGRYVPRCAATALTFVLVLLGWLFFRSQSLTQAVDILSILLTPSAYAWQPLIWGKTTMRCVIYAVLLVNFLLAFQWAQELKERIMPYGIGAMLLCALFYRGTGDAFIYFQF